MRGLPSHGARARRSARTLPAATLSYDRRAVGGCAPPHGRAAIRFFRPRQAAPGLAATNLCYAGIGRILTQLDQESGLQMISLAEAMMMLFFPLAFFKSAL